MSLFKQLWLAIIFMMTLAFVGSFFVSSLSAKTYLETQLTLKNLDNANALALSLSNGATNSVTLDLLIAAQYDTGHYQMIRLTGPDEQLISERIDHQEILDAPAWLVSLFPIHAMPGIAQVSNGWQSIGTLTVESHSRFAYGELWKNTQRLFSYFVVAGLSCGILGSILLKLIISPLKVAINQAKAIGEQRFVTAKVPRTREFRILVQAMNQLSAKVQNTLKTESQKLDKWRLLMQHDRVTGLLDRSPFIARFNNVLLRDDASSSGIIIIFHIMQLAELNRDQGHQVMNRLLKEFGITLQELAHEHIDSLTGRLNGSDFVLTIPGGPEIKSNTERTLNKMQQITDSYGLREEVDLKTITISYHHGDSVTALLNHLDQALLEISPTPTGYTHVANEDVVLTTGVEFERWKSIITTALAEKEFTLDAFPVQDLSGKLLHWEAPARLILENEALMPAGQFMPWLSRLNLSTTLDQVIVDLALKKIALKNAPIGINLSTTILTDESVMQKVAERVGRSSIANKLWIELPESGIHHHLAGFRQLCTLLKPHGCKLGIEHVGAEVSHIGEFHDLGLDYIKIDGAFIHQVDTQVGNQVFLRGLCSIVHSIGLIAIAENVRTEQEWLTLKNLGVDGGTGPYFHSS